MCDSVCVSVCVCVCVSRVCTYGIIVLGFVPV